MITVYFYAVLITAGVADKIAVPKEDSA